MADISDINSALQVKVVGQDADGVETTPVGSLGDRLKVDASSETDIATGTISALGNTVSTVCSSKSTAVLHITGTFVGTIAFEVSLDEVSWAPLIGHINGLTSAASATSASNFIIFRVAGWNFLRVRASAWTSGSASIRFSKSSLETMVSAWQFGTWSTRTQDGVGNPLTSVLNGARRELHTNSTISATNESGTTVNIGSVGNSLKSSVTFEPTAQVTPLGILKTSSARVLFNFSERYDNEEAMLFSSSVVSGATVTHNTDRAVRVLSVTATAGSKAIRQTRRYFRYIKGSPQTIVITGNLKGLVAGVVKTLGYFDEENGIFLRLNGATPQVGVRSKTSGSIVDTLISRASWDDPLDGTGDSGVTIDWSKQQFFYFDFAWLGIAQIRFGIYIDGKIVFFHKIQSANIIETSWSQTAVLPLRFEIENVSGAATTMETACYLVSSEDQESTQDGSFKSASSGATTLSANTTEQVFFGLRINPLSKGNILPFDYGVIIPSGNSVVYFKIILHPTLTAPTWVDVPDSIAQTLSNQPAFTGGHIIDEGYAQVGASSVVRPFKSDAQLGRSLTDQDVIILVVRTLSGNSSLLYQATWREDT